jgi:hypothetical protein
MLSIEVLYYLSLWRLLKRNDLEMQVGMRRP